MRTRKVTSFFRGKNLTLLVMGVVSVASAMLETFSAEEAWSPIGISLGLDSRSIGNDGDDMESVGKSTPAFSLFDNFNSFAEPIRPVDYFGVFPSAESHIYGLDLGILATQHHAVYGAQIATTASRVDDMAGIVIAGLWSEIQHSLSGIAVSAAVSESDRGVGALTVAGMANVMKRPSAVVQITAVLNTIKTGNAIQIGLVNEAEDGGVVQIGCFNTAGEASCVQLGLMSFGKELDSGLPVLRIHW